MFVYFNFLGIRENQVIFWKEKDKEKEARINRVEPGNTSQFCLIQDSASVANETSLWFSVHMRVRIYYAWVSLLREKACSKEAPSSNTFLTSSCNGIGERARSSHPWKPHVSDVLKLRNIFASTVTGSFKFFSETPIILILTELPTPWDC